MARPTVVAPPAERAFARVDLGAVERNCVQLKRHLGEAAGLMTHFATADDPDPAYLGEQLARFADVATEAKRALPGIVVHAANSAAALGERRSHFDMARCGIAIYGLDPFQQDPRDRG